jgi:hypothetical protein
MRSAPPDGYEYESAGGDVSLGAAGILAITDWGVVSRQMAAHRVPARWVAVAVAWAAFHPHVRVTEPATYEQVLSTPVRVGDKLVRICHLWDRENGGWVDVVPRLPVKWLTLLRAGPTPFKPGDWALTSSLEPGEHKHIATGTGHAEDEVAADWRRPSLPARPAACCDAGGSKPGLCGLPGHAELPISCGYLPLLKQCSLTLSINYFVTQSCPCYTPIDSDPATLHPVRPLRHRSSPEQAAAPVRPWDPLAIATSAQVGVRSKQVMNSPLNQCYVPCMLVSRPTSFEKRARGAKSEFPTTRSLDRRKS